jgi:Ser/Thr protein kinase RdoA (MazF antagonist)
VGAVDLVRRACEAGIQTIVLTDHHYQGSEDELADLRRQAALPEIFQILSGQEVDTYDFGHVLVQTHGDFHARNIFISRDEPDGGEYVTALDFESSYQLPRAFDVGTFLAQYVSMFFHERDVQRHAPADIFLRVYLERTRDLEADFPAQVNLFKARTCLSILYYFAKTQRGESEEFWRILVEAERSLAALAAGRAGVHAAR